MLSVVPARADQKGPIKMNADTQVESLWTSDQEDKIAEACDYGLVQLRAWGPMHLIALEKALKNGGYDEKVSNDNGSASLAGLAVWRLCKDKKIRTVQRKTIVLKPGVEPGSRDNAQTNGVIEALSELGGIATLENLINKLSMKGYGEKTVENAVKELVKSNEAKHPFILSPNRRVWEPRS